MTEPDTAVTLSMAERAYVRRELGSFFGTLPTVAEGFMLRTRRTGLEAGQPKLPPAARTLVGRGLARVVEGGPWPRLVLTATGVAALRAMLESGRASDRAALAHVRRELGLDPAPGDRDGE